MELIFSKRFQKHAKKLAENKENLRAKITDALFDIKQYGKDSDFYRKPLKGELFGFHEFQIGGDIRIIARIHATEEKIVLEDIGTHSYFGW